MFENPEQSENVEVDLEPTPGAVDEVEIDLDHPTKEVPKTEGISAEEFQKERNRNEYLHRQMQKTLGELRQFTNNLSSGAGQQVQPSSEPDQELDEIDKVAQKDWKKGVSMVIQQELLAEKQKLQAQALQHQQYAELEKSKQLVRERYPEIDDESSETAKEYIRILNSDPSLLQEKRGPELAMYRMEEGMKTRGASPSATSGPDNDVDKEVQRRMRVGATASPAGRPATGNKVTLTKEEINIANQMGVPIPEYAKMKQQGERGFKEGVTVDGE